MHSRWVRIVVLVGVIGIALVGCGGDDDGAEPITEFDVRMDSFVFDPDRYTVVADADVTVTALNVDATLEHEWVIIRPGNEIDTEDEFDEDDILFEVEAVPAQESDTGTFTVGPGEYQVICGIEGHFAAGMEGTLTAVVDDGG